jgi:ABC-type arginine transport system permease subunit
MSTDNLITLITAGLAFLASVIAIIVSVYNARFARFASEKWWERKAEAYTRIIDALSDLVY